MKRQPYDYAMQKDTLKYFKHFLLFCSKRRRPQPRKLLEQVVQVQGREVEAKDREGVKEGAGARARNEQF